MSYKPYRSKYEPFRGHKKRDRPRTSHRDQAYVRILRDSGLSEAQIAEVLREHKPSA